MKKVILFIFLIFLVLPAACISKEADFEMNHSKETISTKTIEEDPETNQQEESVEEENYYEDFENFDNTDAIYLDIKKTKSSENKKKTKIKAEKLNYTEDEYSTISPQTYFLYNNFNPLEKKTMSYETIKKRGDISFGTKYDNSFTTNNLTQTRTLFTKYEKNKFVFNTSYKNSSLTSFDQQFRGTFSFSPEYKLNNHISVQGVYSKNLMDRSNKNEIIFTLKPFKDDRMDFNIGAGQIYYEDATPARSQLNFATKIKF